MDLIFQNTDKIFKEAENCFTLFDSETYYDI